MIEGCFLRAGGTGLRIEEFREDGERRWWRTKKWPAVLQTC